MKVAASTETTFFWKVVFLIVVPLMLVCVTLMFGVRSEWYPALFSGFGMLAFTSYSIWFFLKLKEVCFDDVGIYVAKGPEEIHVPWAEIESIDSLWYMRWPTFVIRFRKNGELGCKVFFCAPFGSRTEAVDRMQELLENSRRA